MFSLMTLLAAHAAPLAHEDVRAGAVVEGSALVFPGEDASIDVIGATQRVVLTVTRFGQVVGRAEGLAPSVDLPVPTTLSGATYEVTVHLAEGSGDTPAYVRVDSADRREYFTRGLVGAEERAVPCDGVPYEYAMTRNPFSDAHDYARPAGAEDPQMWLLDADGLVVDVVSDGFGVEPRSMWRADVCRVVAVVESGRWGFVNVYANDPWNDADGDGLGVSLEAALGTSDKDHDTDGDGLTDGTEVLGFWADGRPQYMAHWGADPGLVDVFIEVHSEGGLVGAPLMAAVPKMEQAQTFFDPGGVRLHFDFIGGDDSLVMDMGGFTQVNPGSDYQTRPEMMPGRRGYFRYMMLMNSGNGGQASYDTLKLDLNGDGPALAHEIGHSLTLGHHGKDAWGKANCKPNYASKMNYAYPDEGFSRGTNGDVINPAAVTELGFDAQFLARMATDEFGFDIEPSVGGVDFNGDGIFSKLVRGMPTYASGNGTGCSAATINQELLAHDDAVDGVTPVVFTHGGRIYALYVKGGRLWYQTAEYEANGPEGSCTGTDELGGPCFKWSRAYDIPHMPASVQRFDAVSYGSAMAVAVTMEDGHVRVVRGVPDSADGLVRVWSIADDLNLRTWVELDLAVVPAGWRLRGKVAGTDISGIPADADQDRLVVFAADPASDSVVYAESTGWGFNLTLHALDANGDRIPTSMAPSVLHIDAWDVQDVCAAFPDDSGKPPETASAVVLYCLDPADGTWVDQRAWTLGAGSTVGKVAMAYHVARDADGSLPYNPSPLQGHGQLWMIGQWAGGQPRTWRSEQVLQADGSLDYTFTTGVFAGNTWLNPLGSSSMTVFEDRSLSAMKGAIVLAGNPDDPKVNDRVAFLPTADGSFRAPLTDGDDFEAMDACAYLHTDSNFCD